MNNSVDFKDDPYFMKFIDRPLSSGARVKFINAMRIYLQFFKEVKGIVVFPKGLLDRIEEDRKKPIIEAGGDRAGMGGVCGLDEK